MTLSASRERALALALIAGITAVHWLTLAPGQDWGDDFAMYVAHTRNLVEGRSYSDTGYVFNPEHPRLGPRNYPPVTPLLLMLPYQVGGPDLDKMKRCLLLLFPGFLAAFYAGVRPLMGPESGPPLALLLAVGLSPPMLYIERSVVSEIPFLLFLYFALWLFRRLEQWPPATRGGRIAAAIGLGLALYLCYGTRSVGLALIAALVAHDLLRFRRLRSTSLIALAVFLPCATLESRALFILDDYGSSVGIGMPSNPVIDTLNNLMNSAKTFPVVLSWAWRGELPMLFEAPFALLLFGLSALGFVATLRREMTLYELFALAYLGMLAVLPFGGDLRRLTPVLPLFFYYVAQGVRAVPGLETPRHRQALGGLVALGLAVSYADLFARTDWGPPTDGIDRASTRELFDFVRREAAADGPCVFFKPRALALYTGCPTAVYQETRDLASLDRFFASIGASWFIVKRDLGAQDPLARWVQRRGDRLEPKFENADFQVYRRLPDAPPRAG